MNYKYELTGPEHERFVGLIINYGMACIDVGMADDGRRFDFAFAKKTRAFKEIFEYLDLLAVDNN